MRWITVKTRKPKLGKIVLINVFWWNSIDSGNANDFAYWSPDRNRWVHFDKGATDPEMLGPHMNAVVTHWSEQPEHPKHKVNPKEKYA